MCIQHTRCKNNSTAVRCNSCDNKTIGRHRVAEFTNTYAISAYHHRCEFESRSG